MRLSLQQSNFTAGEISPRLYGRTDIDRYGNAAKTLLNAYPVIHGGAKRRDGTRFLQATKISAKKSRLIPFVYSRDDAYMLEFGDSYLRVFKNTGRLPGGGADAPSPRRCWRTSTSCRAPTRCFWRTRASRSSACAATPMRCGMSPLRPSLWSRSRSRGTPQLGPHPVGHQCRAGRTVSASALGTFLPADVGRVLVGGTGQATLTAYNSPTSMTATITLAFAAHRWRRARGIWMPRRRRSSRHRPKTRWHR
jgi:hypothetical protein